MTRHQRTSLEALGTAVLVLFTFIFAASCQSSQQLPDRLAHLPDPIVVSSDELTPEMIQREHDRTTLEGVLVVRYPVEEFEELYGDVQPLEEQEWWQEVAEGRSAEEFLRSEAFAGRPYLATVRVGQEVYVSRECKDDEPPIGLCMSVPGPVGLGGVDRGIPVAPQESLDCEVTFAHFRHTPCRQRTGCETQCEPLQTAGATTVPGISCFCRGEFGLPQ